MILLDTTPLVALVDRGDPLHRRAVADLDRLARRPLAVCEPVLTEAVFLLRHGPQRARLAHLLEQLRVDPWAPEDARAFRAGVLVWLARHAEHEPDWADGTLVVASQHAKKARVWTYDSEFRTTWRRPDGSKVPLASAR